MNVLSLFDGMSCGQIALNKLGIKYSNYFASEIDKHAMKVTQSNYPNTKQIGSVLGVKGVDLPKIDLLFGGSPCQSFSRAGDGSGFDGKSKLFWEFIRVLNEVKPKYFLLENVVMKKEWEQVITDTLEVSPVRINSNLLSAQNRDRLYWTNIPNTTIPRDKGIELADIFEEETNEKVYEEPYYKKIDETRSYIGYLGKQPKQATKVFSVYGKSVCLSALGGGQGGKTGLYEIPNTNTCRKLTATECERLQTVPVGYTEGGQ